MENIKIILGILVLSLLILPFRVSARTETVNTEEELTNALNSDDVTTIELGQSIDITETIVVSKEKTIDGKNHTLKYVGLFKGGSSDNTVWGNNTNGRGVYIIQVYNTKATIKDIKLTGGNAGLLINGSDVKLEGNIDVSGNGFGGIELGQGSGISSVPNVEMNNVKLINDSESTEKPTIWIDAPEDVIDKITVTVDGKKLDTAVVDGKVNVYLDKNNLPADTNEDTNEDTNQDLPNTPVDDEITNPETNDNLWLYALISFGAIGILIYGLNKYAER